jgi:hypothetical protein
VLSFLLQFKLCVAAVNSVCIAGWVPQRHRHRLNRPATPHSQKSEVRGTLEPSRQQRRQQRRWQQQRWLGPYGCCCCCRRRRLGVDCGSSVHPDCRSVSLLVFCSMRHLYAQAYHIAEVFLHVLCFTLCIPAVLHVPPSALHVTPVCNGCTYRLYIAPGCTVLQTTVWRYAQ